MPPSKNNDDGTEVTKPDQRYDDDYWIEKSSKESIDLMKCFKVEFNEFLGEYDLNYRKVFIGLKKGDKANNFVYFTPQKKHVVVSLVIDKTKSIDNRLKVSKLEQLSYDEQFNTYKIRLNENDLSEKRDILNFLVKTAFENNDTIQKEYWIEKSSEESMDLMKRFKSTFAEYIGDYDLRYRKAHIGLSKDGSANNFVFFTPQKNGVVVWFVIDKTEEIDVFLEKTDLDQLSYDKYLKTYKIKISKKDLSKNRDALNFMVKTAYENNRYHQNDETE